MKRWLVRATCIENKDNTGIGVHQCVFDVKVVVFAETIEDAIRIAKERLGQDYKIHNVSNEDYCNSPY